MAQRHARRHDGPLGTVVHIVVGAGRMTTGAVERFVLAEIERLQSDYSAFDLRSQLSRWAAGELDDDDTSDRFRDLLALAQHWQRRTDGVFNPLVGRASRCWRIAEETDRLPTDDSLRAIAADIATPAFLVTEAENGRRVERTGSLDGFQLNALAKGKIVDDVFDATRRRFGLADLLISAGGDVRMSGTAPFRVAVEQPARHDAPVVIALSDGALATSGGMHRYVRVGGRRHSHLIDPRTARPVEHIASASVLADDLATADVLATVLTVLEPDEGRALADRLRVGCLIRSRTGETFVNAEWEERTTLSASEARRPGF